MQSFPTYCTLYDYEGTETSFRKHMQTDETVQAKLRKHTFFYSVFFATYICDYVYAACFGSGLCFAVFFFTSLVNVVAVLLN